MPPRYREPHIGFDYDAVETPAESPGSANPDHLEFGRRIISYVRKKDRARLTIECLHLAIGDGDLEQDTMTSVAKKHGITKAAISKRVQDIRTDLKLSINANNKSTDACHRYAKTNSSPLRLDKSPRGD